MFLAIGPLALRHLGGFLGRVICPGVALSVMLQFWINKALVGAGLIARVGTACWTLTGIAIALQVAMILLLLGLNRRHFGRAGAMRHRPAEWPSASGPGALGADAVAYRIPLPGSGDSAIMEPRFRRGERGGRWWRRQSGSTVSRG